MDVSEDSKVSPRRRENLKVEPGELLEEGWFFGNLLDSKIRIMSRCFSDPCPSSKLSQEMLVGTSYEETTLSTKKVLYPGDDRVHPPSFAAMDIDMDNLEDEDTNYSMGRLIRQASLGQSHTLPPRQHTPKKQIPSTIPKKQYPRMKPEQEGSIPRSRQQILKQTQNKTSFANVETEQVKDFKGSCNDIPTKEIKTLPKLPEEAMMEEDEDKDFYQIIKVRKPYVQGARRLGRTVSASPVLDNIDLPRTADNMKAQIKFWARSVASNVR
ncbi:hypothetical protein LIER_33384 [Lithospermum erythrorhizon]|uniref:Uncharacterized protein n=1 Tax=Lithospermum erythrorhizon TaxID=34254 RepID=A0AAV3RWH1_LITER